ncbi:MAG: histidine phosphatase family protein [Acidiferrobacteraceae bacterium]
MNDALPKVYLVRHGETAWSLSGQHTGHTDVPLTERGEHDAQALSARLHGLSFAKVLSSPLKRAWRTGELAGFCECVQADPDLTEWDYGIYEGRRTVDIRAARPGWRLFEDGCPDGETLVEISARAERVIARIHALESDVLVFAHRDILRILAARWVALPALEARRFQLAPASVSILGYDHHRDEPVIQQLNDTTHHG